MKKYLLILFSVLVLLTSCTKTNGNSNQSQSGNYSKDSLAAYFPLKENVLYEYENPDIALSNYKVFNSHINGKKLQRMFISEDSVSTYILDVQDKEIKLFYSDLGNYFYQNYTNLDANDSVIVLKGPIKLGEKWNPDSSTVCEITSLDVKVKVPAGDFNAIEVTLATVRGDGKTNTSYLVKEYYAKDIGLIQQIQQAEGGKAYVTSLKSIKENTPNIINMTIFYPNSDDYELEEFPSSINFNTNDNGFEVLEKLLKTDLDGSGLKLISENTKINKAEFVVVEENNSIKDVYFLLDLSKDYISEMNAGSGFESGLLQGLANTICNYTKTKKLKLTIDGNNYESGHFVFEEDDFLNLE